MVSPADRKVRSLMALSDHDQSRIRHYLLGRLTDKEEQELEERLMVEDDLFEELEISKGELIEEYRAGELNKEEAGNFEQGYLASPEARQRYIFTAALDCLPAPVRQVTLIERVRSFLTTQKWALAAVAAVLVVAVLIFSVQFSRPRTSMAVTLSNSLSSRSSVEPKYHRISLKPDIDELRVSLTLPDAVVRGTNYRVVLDNRGKPVTLTPTAYDTKSVLVVIPTSQLPPGLYSLKLVAIDADRTERPITGDYFFQITN
jgi:methionine-rich copper-binding protein CopC